MKKLLVQALTVILAAILLSSTASAAVKVRGDLSHIQTVAVVGYSFWRDPNIEDASPFKFKREVIELTEDDPEYIMMHLADDRVMEALQVLGTFTVLPREDVLANELYISETKDPESKLALNWYFPKDYRVIKLKKKNAIALCESLGVDAVILIEFKHAGSEKTSSWGGVYSKGKTIVTLQGEITLFDSSGKELISGSAKSDPETKSTSHGWGNADNGISTEVEHDAEGLDEIWATILASYLSELNEDITKE